MYALSMVVVLIVPMSFSSLQTKPTGCGGQCQKGTYCSEPDNYCKCQPGLMHRREQNGSFTCETDIDECQLEIYDCPPNSSCVNFFGSYRCHCAHGLYKDKKGYCKPDVDECQLGTADCPLNTECTNTPGSYMCTCSPGFSLNVNGTCTLDANGISIAWYWWVGCSVLGGLLVVCGICKFLNRRYDSDTDSDLGKDVLMELTVEDPHVATITEKGSAHSVRCLSSSSFDGELKSYDLEDQGSIHTQDNTDGDNDGQPSSVREGADGDRGKPREQNHQQTSELTEDTTRLFNIEDTPLQNNQRKERVIIEPVPDIFKYTAEQDSGLDGPPTPCMNDRTNDSVQMDSILQDMPILPLPQDARGHSKSVENV